MQYNNPYNIQSYIKQQRKVNFEVTQILNKTGSKCCNFKERMNKTIKVGAICIRPQLKHFYHVSIKSGCVRGFFFLRG